VGRLSGLIATFSSLCDKYNEDNETLNIDPEMSFNAVCYANVKREINQVIVETIPSID